MRPVALSVFLLAFFPAIAAHSAEMAIGTNFTVLAPNQAVAEAVLKQAEVFRKQSALEWLGKELPDRDGRSLITVDIKPEQDEGLTWPIDSPERTLHQVWLTTSAERTVGTTLHHEVIHTVLDSYFYPGSLSAWASEGIASQADNAKRKEDRRQILARWSRAGRWPSLRPLLDAARIGHDNLGHYTIAASLTEFLAERGGKAKVVKFAASGQKHGWDQAVSEFYGMHDVAELQTAWQDWLTKKTSTHADD